MNAKTVVPSLLIALTTLTVGCDREESVSPAMPSQGGGTASTRPSVPEADAPRNVTAPRVVFLGDSLTAGLGLEADQAFPAVVGRMLEEEGLPTRVVNAGVSGDTTAGGLSRLDWLLRQSPEVVVVGLGGNDGLRGIAPKASEENLRATVRRCRAAGASVLLLGMLIPPNYGPEYTQQFREVYPRVARETDVPLVPFLLEGVGGDPRLNQPDGIHPTAEGHQVIARNVLPHLRPIVRRATGDGPTTAPAQGGAR